MKPNNFQAVLSRTVAVPVIAMAILAALLLLEIQSLKNSMQWVDHTDQVIGSSQQLIKLVVDMETGFRGYLNTGKAEFLQPYDEANSTIDARFDALNRLVSDNPAQQARLASVRGRVDDWRLYASRFIALRTLHEVSNYETYLRDKQLMDALRAENDAFIATEERLLNERVQTTRKTVRIAAFICVVLSLSVGAFLAMFTRRRLHSLGTEFQESLEIAEKRAEEMREQAELIEIDHDAIMVRELDGMIRFWNHGAEEIYGYSKEQAVGRISHQLLGTVFPKPLAEIEADILRLGRWDGDLIHTTQDGRRIVVASRWAARRDKNGRVLGMMEINNDITERRQAEEERTQLAAIVESSGDAIISKSLEGIVTSWNPSAERLFGYTAEEVIGRPISVLIPPERQDEEAEFLERLGRGERIDHYDTVRVDKSGRPIDVSVTLSPVCDATGAVIGISKSVRDITERKRAEEALRSSQAKLQGVIGSAMDAIISVDDAQRIVVFNQAAENIFQCPAAEALGSNLDRFIPQRLRGVHREHIKRFGAQGVTNRSMNSPGVLTGVRSNGEEFPIEATISQVQASGQTLYTVILRDITERKQAEEVLRLRMAALDAAANSIVMTDAAGKIQWVNPAFTKMTGYTAEEAIGQNPRVLKSGQHEDDFYKRMWEKVLSGSTWRGELINRRKDGSLYVEEMTITPVRAADGSIRNFLAVKEDVTERKHAEQALQASEHRWSTTLRSIGDAVISTDPSGRIDFMNEVAQRLTGWTLAEANGRELAAVFDIVQEVTRIRPESPVDKVIRFGKVVGLANHTVLIHRDGSEIPIEDSAAPIRDSKGEMEGVVLVFHDVLEQRRAEAALRSSERLATTGRLAATIAHEIHNPLDAVGNLLFLIREEAKDDGAREYASMAGSELARVTQLTQQMLGFQREAARPMPVKIGEILANVVALYERKIKEAGIRLEQQIHPDLQIVALPGELRQIFANLVGNAIEAVGPRRGTIALRAYPSQDWRRGVPGLCVVVADNGPGIPLEVRSKIFEPFFTTKGESGTGLGLWITSDILRKYDGTMRLRSCTAPGRSGTCFSIFLPFEINSESAPRP
jgi:nitrogen fixation negative regulator NifL